MSERHENLSVGYNSKDKIMTTRTIKPITEIAIQGLTNLENNYLRMNKSEGGNYTLVEVRRELQRRQGGNYDGSTVFKKIIELASERATGFTTYGRLFSHLHNKPWVGNGSQQLLNKDLGAVIYHCVQNELPIVTTLIIGGNQTQLTELAMQNIYDCAKHLGVKNMPSSAKAFVLDQQEKSLALVSQLTTS